jgi:hypothetical protein
MIEDELKRLHVAEQQIAEIRVEQEVQKAAILNVTVVANSVKADTAEIVMLMKGSVVIGQVARWVAMLAAGYLAGKGLGWW